MLYATASIVMMGVSGCTMAPTPLVSDDVVASIQADGREYTYDVAWQNTRLVVDLVERHAYEELDDVALHLSARLHRLENARADNMADRATAKTVSSLEEGAQSRTREENRAVLVDSATKALVAFDDGDFRAAKTYALDVFVIARWFTHQQ
jgi:hypothetical protein